MKFLKSHFALSRSQQNGIFALIVIIILLQLVIFGMNYFQPDTEPVSLERLEAFEKQLDSLEQNQLKAKDTIYPFNPNFLTDFKAYRLGLSTEEIDRLLAYRKKGKWINSAADFRAVTGISEDLFQKIAPSLRFPEWVEKSGKAKILVVEKSAPVKVADLNLATAADLQVINGIGEKLSERIVKYRSRIGGFLDPVQLKDVYGLQPEVIERILQKFQIITKPQIEIRNINTLNEAELAKVPYFNNQLAREIINYKNLNESISSFEELSKINGFPSDKIDRIKLYLAVD
ncbi:ComEA family DNA-binding protein [Christiangramia aquimixticola]|uniref:ComEA family DNA-binding protein n=1 Tax=Christiangramia aquimixticola TaxID=1697558 RepID=UPI003AA8BF7E